MRGKQNKALHLSALQLRYAERFDSFEVCCRYGQMLVLTCDWWFDSAWLEQGSGPLQCNSPVRQRIKTGFDRVWIDFAAAVEQRWIPLMEPLRGDEPGVSVAAPEATGLPPGVILSVHYLEDVAPFKGHSCLLARDGGILIGVVVKKSLNKQLRTMARKKQTNIPLFSHKQLLNC